MKKKFTKPDGKIIEVEAKDMNELLHKAIVYMNKYHPKTEEELMLYQAYDFHRLADEIAPKSHDKESLKGKPAVFTVNASFALEVYLKLAVKISTKKKKFGHELQIIFNALSDNAKKEIEEMVQKKAQKLWPYSAENITAKSIVLKLNDAFVNWRYSYEYDDNENPKTLYCPIDETRLLLDVLNRYCTKHMKQSCS